MTGSVRLKWLLSESDVRAKTAAETLPLLSVSISWGVRRREASDGTTRAASEDLSNYKVCRAGDLVINRMRAFQGALGIAPEDGVVSPDYAVLRVDPKVDKRWLNYYLSSGSTVSTMASIVRGIGGTEAGNVRTPRLNVSDLQSMNAPLVSEEEQRAIADYLDRETARIDTLIKEQQRLIEMLDERRVAVMNRAVRQGIRGNLRLRPHDDPSIGSIPEGWQAFPLRRLATSLDGARIPLSAEDRALRQGPYPYYGATAIIDRVDDFLFDEPLVLVAEDGFGLLFRSKPIAVAVDGKIWVNNHAHVLRANDVPAPLLAARIEVEDVAPYLSGSRQPKFTAGALKGMRLSFPPPEEWQEILDYLDGETGKIDTLIEETERFLGLARERRSAIITAAVTGQIDVRGVA
ncbi:restriction endonuclease subunit S [Nakamurella lactea]|uniref:restriction endonuclease subunit S n=1 Tax=Nakamurella lactea TaxID=459515 RepID=UPI000426CAEE|nr:restriction endonuclease subunit S [Nakamurella lactea]